MPPSFVAPSGPFPAPAASLTRHYVIFALAGQQYALPLECVARAVRMVACTPAPAAPPEVLGLINMAGQVLPVVDLRRRFGLPARAPLLTDRLLIVTAPGQTVALQVDEVLQVLEAAAAQPAAAPPAVLAQQGPLLATLRRGEALILVLDVARLLPLAEFGPA